MKDIFIDNNVAKNFATPLDKHYKDLITWINEFDKELVDNNPNLIVNYAHLVVSQKLLTEYLSSSYNSSKTNAIPVIISRLTIQGRLIKISKKEIDYFISEKFSKTIIKKLKSNVEDHCHLVAVLLSNRKLCLTYDKNLSKDLNSFPGYTVVVRRRPEDINYR